jgi:hypothetical protein
MPTPRIAEPLRDLDFAHRDGDVVEVFHLREHGLGVA